MKALNKLLMIVTIAGSLFNIPAYSQEVVDLPQLAHQEF